MCKSSKPKTPEAPANNQWDWWKFQEKQNQTQGGRYRLNRLAIGDILRTSTGTSQLKNTSFTGNRNTKGTNDTRPKPMPLPSTAKADGRSYTRPSEKNQSIDGSYRDMTIPVSKKRQRTLNKTGSLL